MMSDLHTSILPSVLAVRKGLAGVAPDHVGYGIQHTCPPLKLESGVLKTQGPHVPLYILTS